MISFPFSAKARTRSGKREEDGNRRTAVSLFCAARNGDLASASFDKLPGHPKSDARSELSLGGEERLKDLFQVFLFYSRPAVLDYRLNSISTRTNKLSDGNLQRAPLDASHRQRSL